MMANEERAAFRRSPEFAALEARYNAACAEIDAVLAECERLCPAPEGAAWGGYTAGLGLMWSMTEDS